MSITDRNGKEVIGFADYMGLDLFARGIFFDDISLKKVEEMQDKMESKIEELKKYNPRIQERKYLQKIILNNGQNLFKGREAITEAFKKHIFQFRDSESDLIKSKQNFEKKNRKKSEIKRTRNRQIK